MRLIHSHLTPWEPTQTILPPSWQHLFNELEERQEERKSYIAAQEIGSDLEQRAPILRNPFDISRPANAGMFFGVRKRSKFCSVSYVKEREGVPSCSMGRDAPENHRFAKTFSTTT